MTDTIGYGQEKRREGNLACLEDKISFRDSFQDMMDSVTKPYDQCIQYVVDNVKLDLMRRIKMLEYALRLERSVSLLSRSLA